jgi:hypothetical protein
LVGILCLLICAVTAIAASASMSAAQLALKKIFLDEKYSVEELEVRFGQWETLMRQLFIKRRPS